MKWEVQDIPGELSAKIRNMSFVCALLVVCIHCNVSLSVKHDVFWLMQLTTCTLCEIAVPFFFMISGFLLAGKMQDCGWWRLEVSKRVKSLLVPFIIATVIYIALTIPIDAIKDMRHGDIFKHNPFVHGRVLEVFGLDFSSPPILAPLWYLRALFMLVVLSPLLKWLIGVSRGFVVPAAFVAYYLLSPIVDGEPVRAEMGKIYGFFRYGFSLEGLSYFSLGMVFRRWRINMDLARNAQFALILALSGLAMSVWRTVLVYRGMQPSVHWTVFAIPCYLFSIFHFVPTKPFPPILTVNSFAIFVVHYFPNFVFSRCVGKAAKHWHTMLLNFAFVVPVTLFICEALRRKCPRFAKVLFGGR